MTLSEFREWSASQGLELSGSLTDLESKTIAIDADEYLQTILTTPATREPLLPAIGGLPFSLQKTLDRDLKAFDDAKITPWFVFNGLDVAAKDDLMINHELSQATKDLAGAWSIYEQGKGAAAVQKFGRAHSFRIDSVTRWIKAYLHKRKLTVQVAPYVAAAQLEYLESSDTVDAVYGDVTCLLSGSEKIITSIDFEKESFTWVERDACLESLSMKQEAFADLMLIAGFSILSPLPEIDDVDVVTRAARAKDLLTSANLDGYGACMNAKNQTYADALVKSRFVFRHAVTLQKPGNIVVKDAASSPNDVHAVIGQQLPVEVYYYLLRGIVSPRTLQWRTRNEILELQPLEGGSAQAYREFTRDKLRPLRSQSLALLTRHLHRYYQRTDVEYVSWWRIEERNALNLSDILEDSTSNADSWHVPASQFEKTSDSVHSSPIAFAVRHLAQSNSAQATVTSKADGDGRLRSANELIANTTWRFLHDRGYINPDHTLSAWGKALHTALDKAKSEGYLNESGSALAEESVIMAFELLRHDTLNGKLVFTAPLDTGAPSRGTDADRANTLLISRIASLGGCSHKAIGYTGPLSRNLLAYHQIAAALRESLRDLVEMHACNLLLSAAVSREVSPLDLSDFGAHLPFLVEPDLGLGLVVKSYLDELSSSDAKRVDISEWFTYVEDVSGDLKRAWSLWGAINTGVQSADSSIVTNETRKLFKNTDDWLQQKLKTAP